MIEIFTGLVQESRLARQNWRDDQLPLPVCAGREVPELLFADPPNWVRVEDQQRTNSCAANAGTTCAEKLVYMRGGSVVQLCRNYLYLRGQEAAGMPIRDAGCTLGGIIRALKTRGVCPEELWPFTGQFQSRVPAGCDEAASKYKVVNTLDVESAAYNGFRAVIGQNIGAVLMATMWPVQLDAGYRVERYRPLGGGGHAIAALFLSTEKDSQDRPYVWVANSHSTAAQRSGWMLWSPTAIDELIQRDEWGATGLTDMTVPAPRKFDWTKEGFFS